MPETSLVTNSQEFLQYLESWLAGLPTRTLAEVMPRPERAAIVSVDVLAGFCTIGPLSSPRVAGIVQPIVHLFQAAWKRGMHNIVLSQEAHEPNAVEFEAWPVHCVRGTAEAETVAAIKALPFFDQMVVAEKNSIAPGLSSGLKGWIASHPQVDTYIAVGDCTDLCTYQLAMHLRVEANQRQEERRVIVPADCSETYDRPVAAARAEGGLPHPGDLLHAVFLYHMALNGIEVVKTIV